MEMKVDLGINSLHINFTNAAGQEHRIEPLTRRALDLTAERLPMHLTAAPDVESLAIEPIRLRLGMLSDDEAANQIAGAILEALALKLKV